MHAAAPGGAADAQFRVAIHARKIFRQQPADHVRLTRQEHVEARGFLGHGLEADLGNARIAAPVARVTLEREVVTFLPLRYTPWTGAHWLQRRLLDRKSK